MLCDAVQVATFDMVEDFWGIFNNIRPPSRLNPGSNYHLFKVGIEPTWEHQANMAGGKWNYCIPKKDGKKVIDDMWLYTILAMIGENFEAGHELCGAVISLRKAGDRVAVWTKSADDEKACLEIGEQFKSAIQECLQVACRKTADLCHSDERYTLYCPSGSPLMRANVRLHSQNEVPKDALEYHVHNDALQSSKSKNDKGVKVAKFTL